MNDAQPTTPVKTTNRWLTPEVLIPLLGVFTTIVVAIIGLVPTLIEANKPAVTPTPLIVLVATSVLQQPTLVPTSVAVVVSPASTSLTEPTRLDPTAVPSETPTDQPTTRPTDQPTMAPTDAPTTAPTEPPTLVPTDVPVIAAVPTTAPNITLFYDTDSFSILNMSGNRASLEGISFRSATSTWDITPFGGLMKALPHNKCLRMRDATVGNRQPPAACGSTMYGFLEIGPRAIFWRDVESFEVVREGNVIATCPIAAGTCPIYVAQ